MALFSLLSTLALLLLVVVTSARQINDIPPLKFANKFRTWYNDSEVSFRPRANDTSIVSALPKYRTNVSSPRIAMHSVAVVKSTGRIVAFGGMMASREIPNAPFERGTNMTFIYDPPTNTWFTEPLLSQFTPPPRLDHASWSFGDFVYIHGGENETVMSDVWRYYNRTWRMQNFALPNRTGHTINVVDEVNDPNTAYLFGGRDSNGQLHNDLWSVSLNGTVRRILPVGEIPSLRVYHASAVVVSPTKGPILLIHGGYDGFSGLKDLFGYFLRTNRWVRINSGYSETTIGFDGSLIASIALPPVLRHSCQGLWPTMFCVGGDSTGDPVSFEFDVPLNRYVQQFFVNPNHILPLMGLKTAQYVNRTANRTELLVIGGYTGAPTMYSNPIAVFKTTMQMDPCPSPYINTDWLGTCHVCPRGSGYNLTINPHRCAACHKGEYSDLSVCQPCPIGFYNPRNASGNFSSCLPCPKGYFTKQLGAWSLSQCVTCFPGTYADKGTCIKCPAGTYGTVSGALSLDEGCRPCSYGSYSDVGATACTLCPPGTSGPSFVRALDPYQLVMQNMGQTLIGSPPGGCPSTPPLTQLYNDNWFWITIQVRDWGELGAVSQNPYYPVDIIHFEPSLRLYAYFKGNRGRMYYNCRVGQEMIPGCSYVTENQTTALIGQVSTGCGFADQGSVSFQFALRFTTPSPSTVLFIRGDGLRGLNYTFQVINNYQTVSFGKWPTSYVIGQSRPLSVFAWLNGEVEYSSSYNAKILVSCMFLGKGVGTSLSPAYSVNGGASTNLQTISITNGTANISVAFTQFASGCVFKSMDQFGVVTQPNSYAAFSIQNPYALNVTLLTTNTSNWGTIRVRVDMVDAFGQVVTGDNTSRILLKLWRDGTAIMQPSEMIQSLVSGSTTFTPVVHSKNPNRYESYGRFHVIHLSGLSTLLKDNITSRFATHHVNGTTLRLANTSAPIPPLVSVNTTILLEIENVNRLTGEQDASRDVIVQVQMIGCGSRITLFNHSSSVVRAKLYGGHGVVSLYVQGYDSKNCKLNIFEYISNTKISKGFTTTSFDVITPRKAVHDSCQSPSQCATCIAPFSGQVITYNITLRTLLGQLVPIDNTHVVRMVPLGNRSAVVAVDNVTQRLVSGGNASFPIRFLPSTNATGVRFEVGKWLSRQKLNFTYQTKPTFITHVKSLGIETYFALNTAIQPALTCLAVPRVIATAVALTSRVPVWVPQNGEWRISVLAVNDYNVQDTNYFGNVNVKIQNCEQGVFKDLTVLSVHPKTGALTTIYSAATASNAAPSVATSLFDHGNGVVILKPIFTTDADFNAGVRNCDVEISSPGLATVFIKAPEFRKVYPFCEVCPPGYWSPGGTGQNTSTTFHHPGGCMPCSVGTFSAYSGSPTISACSACQTNFGYWLTSYTDNTNLEGAIQCSYQCPYGTGGQIGGGPCVSYTTLARTDVTTNRWAQYGRIGKVCAGSGCMSATACSNGQFYLSCPAQLTRAACEHVDNVGACRWDTLTGTCKGLLFNCLPCPPGTAAHGACTLCSKAAACVPCDAGGWSADRGHTAFIGTYSLAQYRCTGLGYPSYGNRCVGNSTGQCPNGTYATATGATDSSVCLPCPKGYYCHQNAIYNSNGGCPPACSLAQKTTCAAGCYQCPYAPIMLVGSFRPIPCPAGTYNNKTGESGPSACWTCPAGTKCPAGSSEPQWVDTLNTQTSDGKARPLGVTFYGSNDVTLCSTEAADDAQGYVSDGRFTNFKTYWTLNGGNSFVVPTMYKEAWGGKGWSYSAVDRLGNSQSGSVLMNATGAIATQKILLNHELPIDMVARVWVQFNLYEKNLTKLLGAKTVKPFCGLTLDVHYTDGNEMDSYNYTHITKMFAVRPPTLVNSSKLIVGWYLVEIPFKPPRPVRWVQFAMVVQGYYWGTARFDDASLKPSHARICNCSTGYYYNQSVTTSRVCRRCPPGFACSGGTMIRCVKSWSAVSYAGCQYCYDGWECDADGRGRQIPCSRYNKKDNNTETCSPCPLGYACKDGVQTRCDNGFYGDGGNLCIPCQPGYYSLPGAPRIQCERCPPGMTSVAGRWYCTPCSDNHYSVNGTQCARCPDGQFAPSTGADACRSCTNRFLDHYNITIPRNHLGVAVRVVPPYCEPFFKFQVERFVSLSHGSLGVVVPSTESPSVLYNAGPTIGVHTFRVFATSGYLQPEQYADVQVRIVNNAPIANDDIITFPHPLTNVTHALTTLMSNDYDTDLDDIFFASAVQPSNMTQYYAYNVTISADRKTIFINLPAGFLGPANILYTVMDQFHANVADCIAPACKFSTVALATFWCVDAFPVPLPDKYSFPVGQVYSLDVLANDYDIDGDEIAIVNVTAGSLSGIYPAIQKSCPTCPGSCLGTYSGPCTCTYDAQRLKCYPSHKKEYFLDYTANTGVCGWDSFTYSVKTRDGFASTGVSVRNTRCYCMNKAVGFNIIFLLDGTQTTSDFGFQLAFADGVIKRSSSGKNFLYGLIEVGVNKVHQNLSNTYFDLDKIQRDSDGYRRTYTLGVGLAMAAQMISGFGTPGVPNYIVIVSNKDSYDNANVYDSLGVPARFMTISVSPSGAYVSTLVDFFKNPYYTGLAASFVDLTQHTAAWEQDMMDIMCSN